MYDANILGLLDAIAYFTTPSVKQCWRKWFNNWGARYSLQSSHTGSELPALRNTTDQSSSLPYSSAGTGSRLSSDLSGTQCSSVFSRRSDVTETTEEEDMHAYRLANGNAVANAVYTTHVAALSRASNASGGRTSRLTNAQIRHSIMFFQQVIEDVFDSEEESDDFQSNTESNPPEVTVNPIRQS